jgi:lipid II isoglutaminyl synthase (glutamine-hydrolysing)
VDQLRLKIAMLIARSAGFLSKSLGRGAGETLPGRVLLALCPNAIELLSASRVVILVSGTNGKTSTTKELASQVRTVGSVVTSGSGSNLTRGVAGALMKDSVFAVLEVDELHLPAVVAATNPALVLLLNLTRDQLHRMHEVKRVAARWHEMCKTADPSTAFIADVDDPFLNYAITGAASAIRVSFGGAAHGRHPDGAVCPSCGGYLDWNNGKYHCDCGLSNEYADHVFDGGSAGYRNFVLASIAADLAGVHNSLSNIELRNDFRGMERATEKVFAGVKARLRLTKNPASWTEALQGVAGNNVILVLNAREVDGVDTSWIWDVSYASLAGKKVVVTGERGADLAYRLHVEGVESTLVDTFDEAIAVFGVGSVEVLAAYTAFFGLVNR